jgi:hypothetical protein
MKKLFTLIAVLVGIYSTNGSGNNFWKNITKEQVKVNGEPNTLVNNARYAELDLAAMVNFLKQAPSENAGKTPLVVSLPMPDGSFQEFGIVASPVMEPELMAKFPDILTYAGQGLSNPNATIRLDITEAGFHAMMLYPGESVFIDPYNFQGVSNYIIYNKSDAINTRGRAVCEYVSGSQDDLIHAKEFNKSAESRGVQTIARSGGDTLRTYRLALACTGEYAKFFATTPTTSGTLGHMVTSVNRVVGVMEKEIAVRLVLIAKEDTLIFLNGASDPYTNSSGSTMLGENQTTVAGRIGTGNYDFGHVFSTGGGGIASRGSICSGLNKARGVTGSPAPVADAFDIDFVAHEMGHQLGANHPFNGETGNCSGGTRNANTAYEPGSGSSIMAYAGICSNGSINDDLQLHSDVYYHTISFDEIRNYTVLDNTGKSCGVKTVTGNQAPVITSIGSNYTIPKSTPFVLTGAATDPDGDPLTYCWEEFDLGPACLANSATLNAPTLRSYTPTTSPSRIFPVLSSILANNAVVKGEILPSYSRNMKFRLTARDNRSGGGGVTYDPGFVTLTVDGTKGPFSVTQPNTALSWPAQSTQNVTWNVNGTDQSPISTANVNILLSIDGGNTFPFTLASGVPNNGLASVTLPNNTSTTARIKVEAEGNIYFDISNVNFTITAAVTGLNNNDLASESVNVYPNPSKGIFNLSWAGKFQGEITLKVRDVAGRTILLQTINKQSSGFINTLDLGNVSSGIYTLEAMTKDGRLIRKLIVE